MKNYSIILCISHIHDRITGLHSYINCIDSGNIPVVPTTMPGFTAVSKWNCSKNMESLIAELILHAPGRKKEILGVLDEFNVQSGLFTLIMTVDKITIRNPGMHEIQVIIRSKDAVKPFMSIKHPLQMTMLDKK